jgi:hypothetical protein
LLLEPTRTNLVTQSNQFDTTWNLQNLTVTSNQVGVGGSVDAWKLTPSVISTYHRLTNSVTGAENLAVTLSVYAKSDGYNFLRISENGSSGDYATFNLLNGSVANNIGLEAKIEIVGNGWYRCSISIIATPSHRFDMYVMESATIQQPWSGNGTSGVLIYGAQLEAGSYATSYIPTQGGTATRAADACSQTPPSGIIGQTEGTMFIEFDAEEDAPQNMNLINFNNSTQASVLIAKKTSGELRAQVFAGGSALVDINSAIVSGKTKAAIAYKSGDSVLYVNGVGVSDSSTFTFNGTLSDVIFPSHQAYFNYGHKYSVNQALLFKTRLSNAELEALTSN